MKQNKEQIQLIQEQNQKLQEQNQELLQLQGRNQELSKILESINPELIKKFKK